MIKILDSKAIKQKINRLARILDNNELAIKDYLTM